jgi:radical SAM-linked protein
VSALTNDNFKYRFKFTKGEEIKFIGHLDFMVAFQRAIKRADIPIAYSNGFNPHQLLNFASPLSLGYTSIGDYGDLQIQNWMSVDEIKTRLNENMPIGVKILEVAELSKNAKKVMTSLCAASYEVKFEKAVTPKVIEENIDKFMLQDEIIVLKKTKRNLKDTDIKPDILEIENASDKAGKIKAKVNAGSVKNLKPESVAEAFMKYVGLEFNKNKNRYTRLDMYMSDQNGGLVGLIDGVEKI